MNELRRVTRLRIRLPTSRRVCDPVMLTDHERMDALDARADKADIRNAAQDERLDKLDRMAGKPTIGSSSRDAATGSPSWLHRFTHRIK